MANLGGALGQGDPPPEAPGGTGGGGEMAVDGGAQPPDFASQGNQHGSGAGSDPRGSGAGDAVAEGEVLRGARDGVEVPPPASEGDLSEAAREDTGERAATRPATERAQASGAGDRFDRVGMPAANPTTPPGFAFGAGG